MSLFYAVAAVLTALAGVLLTVPRWHRRRWQGESNLDWLMLRQRELSGEGEAAGEALSLDAELRILDEADESAPTPAAAADRNPEQRDWRVLGPVLLLLLVMPPLLYLRLGAIEDVRIADALANLEEATPSEVEALLVAIEARSELKPDNVEYLSLLGEYYTAQNDHVQALVVYEQLLEAFPESPEILARVAQAEYLSGDRELTSRARRRAEAALAINPGQRSALGTLGMAAFESGDYAAAVGYWERLMITEVPGTPGYQMLTTIIAEARERGGILEETAPVPSGPGVEVEVGLPEGVAVSGTVFILARPSGAEQRMPTAVVRRDATQLPLSVRLDDASSMAGQTLSSLALVDIEVQVSPSGQPGRANATWVATAEAIEPSDTARIQLQLRPL